MIIQHADYSSMKISKWKHSDYGTRVYRGCYRWNAKERYFVLVCDDLPKNKEICFESHERAKQSGWRKVK